MGIGGVVQGALGFGFALVAAPVTALVYPAALPVTLLLLSVPMNGFVGWRERRWIDPRGLSGVLAGRVVGAIGGVWILLLVPPRLLSAFFGILVLLAVILSMAGPTVDAHGASPGWSFAAGVASGVMATGAVGGPPLALLYRNRPGPELRSTLAMSFLPGVMISLVALGLAGQVMAWHVILALRLLPGLALGLLASRPLARLADRAGLRRAVLIFAFVSSLAAIAQGITG
ncbi:MAG: sulfite exporter TauE/SafE family protein [Egibacteraceae bacterium]